MKNGNKKNKIKHRDPQYWRQPLVFFFPFFFFLFFFFFFLLFFSLFPLRREAPPKREARGLALLALRLIQPRRVRTNTKYQVSMKNTNFLKAITRKLTIYPFVYTSVLSVRPSFCSSVRPQPSSHPLYPRRYNETSLLLVSLHFYDVLTGELQNSFVINNHSFD